MKKLIKHIITYILELEARLVLLRYKPRIVGVTGTVGKTTTKDMLYSSLAPSCSVRKSPKSYNSEIGLPLTILGEENPWSSISGWMKVLWKGLMLVLIKQEYPEWLILEIGADRPGDIKRAAKLVKPDVAVLTRFGTVPVHVEFFNSPREVFEEKMELVRGMKKDGVVIVNGDDEEIVKRVQSTVAAEQIRQVSVEQKVDVYLNTAAAKSIPNGRYATPIGVELFLHKGEETATIEIHETIGTSSVYPILMACALSDIVGISLEECTRNIEGHMVTPGRMRLVPGVGDTTIVDDSYNSSPVAFESALETLAQLSGVRKRVVVAGDMLELGQHSSDQHKYIGEKVAEVADIIVTVGFRAKKIGERAKEINSKIIRAHFDDMHLLSDYVKENIKKGDVVLVKGSQGARMEKVVKALMVEPERAGELLVRQEKEWEER